MNKLKLLTFLLAALFITSFSSCKKEKDTEPSRKELLTSGQWTGHKIYMYGQDITHLYKEQMNWDMSKNIMKYDAKGTFTDTYEKTTRSGTWEFIENEEKILHNKGEDDELIVTIKTLSAKQFIAVFEFMHQGQVVVMENEYKR
jgi:hypothetical protein